MTSLAWLPGRLGGRLGVAARIWLLRLGSVLGLAHERMGLGPRVLLELSPVTLLLPLDRGFPWLAAGSPAMTARCLKWTGALTNTDSSSVVLEP